MTKRDPLANLSWLNEQLLRDAQVELGSDFRGGYEDIMVHVRYREPPKEWGTYEKGTRWIDGVGANVSEALDRIRDHLEEVTDR